MDDYVTTREAAEILGILPRVLLLSNLQPAFSDSIAYYFLRADVEDYKAKHYAEGDTITSLAKHNGMPWKRVKNILTRAHVRPCGVDRKRKGAYVYARETLRKVEHITGLAPTP